jgi:hypothetical protein
MGGARGLIRLAGAISLAWCLAGCDASLESDSSTATAPSSPFQRIFGPAFAPPGPPKEAIHIDGALLARDRGSVAVSFLGGKAYDPANACSTDYRASAGINGDTLDLQVSPVHHPEQVRPPVDAVCTMEGYGYLFTIVLPVAFRGRQVMDPSSGQLWIAPPERIVELAGLPEGWRLTSITTEPSIPELGRMYQPGTEVPGAAGRFIAIHQAFGGPTSNTVDDPVATRSIHGADVPIGRNSDEGYAAGWADGADHVWFTVVDPAVTLDAFVDMANAVGVPGG